MSTLWRSRFSGERLLLIGKPVTAWGTVWYKVAWPDEATGPEPANPSECMRWEEDRERNWANLAAWNPMTLIKIGYFRSIDDLELDPPSGDQVAWTQEIDRMLRDCDESLEQEIARLQAKATVQDPHNLLPRTLGKRQELRELRSKWLERMNHEAQDN